MRGMKSLFDMECTEHNTTSSWAFKGVHPASGYSVSRTAKISPTEYGDLCQAKIPSESIATRVKELSCYDG